MKAKMYDPPSGWLYGFPRRAPADVYLGVKSVKEWLRECGYPEDSLDLAVRHMRTWEE